MERQAHVLPLIQGKRGGFEGIAIGVRKEELVMQAQRNLGG